MFWIQTEAPGSRTFSVLRTSKVASPVVAEVTMATSVSVYATWLLLRMTNLSITIAGVRSAGGAKITGTSAKPPTGIAGSDGPTPSVIQGVAGASSAMSSSGAKPRFRPRTLLVKIDPVPTPASTNDGSVWIVGSAGRRAMLTSNVRTTPSAVVT